MIDGVKWLGDLDWMKIMGNMSGLGGNSITSSFLPDSSILEIT